MKSHARVVVIGGGAVGCSALYHLAQLGWTDAVLLERDELTAGSTWHAAGNCPNFSTSWNILKLQRHSTALYERLAAEVGYDINYHLTGSIRLAHTAERMDEFRHVLSQARAQGIEFEMLTPADIRARHPFIELDGIRGGLWDPKDGDIDPAQLTQALAKGA
ncbi:MAG: FAD-binding oxidoreductase, partial [Gammaproteobacteria bacterium]|nr:FAD-binding oxidoreductase [Gammaproteobacteria bacterium]